VRAALRNAAFASLLSSSLFISLLTAQESELPDGPGLGLDTPYAASIASDIDRSAGSSTVASDPQQGFVRNVSIVPRKIEWNAVAEQSFLFLSAQHLLRLTQPKTRRELRGPFFADYARSVEGLHGWGDGDGPLTNYLLHPGEGAVAAFVYVQNSPSRKLEFDPSSGEYWRSRLAGLAFAAVYSTQFEIGPYSEAMIGNVGKTPGTAGYVDLVMTPVGGFALTVAEDAVDRRWIVPMENNPNRSDNRIRFTRSILNPNRSIANLLRGKAPWFRDSRSMPRRSTVDYIGGAPREGINRPATRPRRATNDD